jgi:plasmid maintenance system antidote protein VapI
MTIKRQDLDAGRIDLADVTTGKRLALVHPGEILRDHFLQPMKIDSR